MDTGRGQPLHPCQDFAAPLSPRGCAGCPTSSYQARSAASFFVLYRHRGSVKPTVGFTSGSSIIFPLPYVAAAIIALRTITFAITTLYALSDIGCAFLSADSAAARASDSSNAPSFSTFSASTDRHGT